MSSLASVKCDHVGVLCFTKCYCLFTAGADKKAEAGAGAATEFQFVSNVHLKPSAGSTVPWAQFYIFLNLDQIDPDLEIPCFAIRGHLIHLTFMPV